MLAVVAGFVGLIGALLPLALGGGSYAGFWSYATGAPSVVARSIPFDASAPLVPACDGDRPCWAWEIRAGQVCRKATVHITFSASVTGRPVAFRETRALLDVGPDAPAMLVIDDDGRYPPFAAIDDVVCEPSPAP